MRDKLFNYCDMASLMLKRLIEVNFLKSFVCKCMTEGENIELENWRMLILFTLNINSFSLFDLLEKHKIINID